VRIFLRTRLNNLLATSSNHASGGTQGSDRERSGGQSGSVAGGSPSPERDNHLVTRAQQGDQEAFRQLVVTYQERILMIVLGMVRNQEDARDIAQDVFIKAYGSLGSFRGQSSFYTWLYRIAVNMAIDFKRKMKRRKESGYDDAIEADGVEGSDIPEPTRYSPQRSVLGKELGGQIQQAMDKLPEDQRMVIVLRELEGLSYKEIADVMKCSHGTVMSRLFYGRKKLQEMLKDFV